MQRRALVYGLPMASLLQLRGLHGRGWTYSLHGLRRKALLHVMSTCREKMNQLLAQTTTSAYAAGFICFFIFLQSTH